MSTINIFVEQSIFYEQNSKFGIILKCIRSYPHFNNISLLNQITVYYTTWTVFLFCFVLFCFVLFCFFGFVFVFVFFLVIYEYCISFDM